MSEYACMCAYMHVLVCGWACQRVSASCVFVCKCVCMSVDICVSVSAYASL